jgi:hypothetical protein
VMAALGLPDPRFMPAFTRPTTRASLSSAGDARRNA